MAFLQLNQTQGYLLMEHMNQSIDAEKLTAQMQFCFTKQIRSTFCPHKKVVRILTPEQKIQELTEISSPGGADLRISIPTNEAIAQIWGEHVIWTGYSFRSQISMGSYTPEQGFPNGDLGQDSSPNPLIEGFMAIFHFTHLALKNI